MRKGQKRTEESKRMQSETRKKRIAEGLIDISKNQQAATKARIGSHHSKETKEVMRQKKLGDLNPSKRQEVKDKIANTLRMKFENGDLDLTPLWEAQGKNRSRIEEIADGWLKEANVSFSTQYCIGRFHVDFFVQPKTVILIDGCYWHGCPEHNADLKDRYLRTQVETEYLEACGYEILRIWEHDIKRFPEESKKKIIDFLAVLR